MSKLNTQHSIVIRPYHGHGTTSRGSLWPKSLHRSPSRRDVRRSQSPWRNEPVDWLGNFGWQDIFQSIIAIRCILVPLKYTVYLCINIYIYDWWFGTCFFPYIGNSNPNWLIFFRGVETTNQIYIYIYYKGYIQSYSPHWHFSPCLTWFWINNWSPQLLIQFLWELRLVKALQKILAEFQLEWERFGIFLATL